MRRVVGIALTVSFLVNLILVYRVIDMGVTSTYGADEISRRDQQAADAQRLLPLLLTATSRTDLLEAAQRASLDVIDKREEGLYIGEIRFVLSGDRVVAVSFD